ncbi:hypothetical protein C8R32_1231 [Nitrosospira sp. Nsp5]|uniref:Uncharacterized protein n=1 Tax=Nitrosospira multiformis TaxID=1231 RepID=A0ABY0TDJ7_9PROT|nr:MULTISPECIES: hypothetical protein [Nitrosospira]PTR05337.1 hypothetical protein C8R32_1231 [Nitrosospira sp. Nsp5]SDQ66960.1 hypothetical protein SAMN05216402_1779 [Nitrosospira multiformis]
MFESKYVDGETIPPFDDAVSTIISSYKIEGGGNTMCIAIENLEGKIYRVIKSIGLGAYMYATSSLHDIGLKDILAKSIDGKNGYDGWFVVVSSNRGLD